MSADLFARDFPRTHDIQDVWEALLLVALCLFFVDVLVRRVVVDVRKVAKTAWDRTRALLTMKQLEPAPADARLATLLQRKAQLREESTSRYSGQAGQAGHPASRSGVQSGVQSGESDGAPRGREPVDDVTAGSSDVLGGFESGGTSPAPEDARQDSQRQDSQGQDTQGRDSRAKSGKSGSKTDDESSPGGYTARLLQAKKRALKNQRYSEEGD